MTIWHIVRAFTFTVTMVVAGAALGVFDAVAQSRRPAAPPAKAEAASAAWQDCSRVQDPAQRDAISKATELLAQLWLATERGYFAAYTMEGEKRNPFDLTPKAPDSAGRDGIVQARPPHCTWRSTEAPGAIGVRFIAPFYRFYEAGPGWSPPLRNGLMLEAQVERVGETLQARDTGGERSALLPEQKPRSANPNALPPDAAWAEPIPGCGRRAKWNGEACIPRKK
jgi:hypothetical protein